MEDAMVTYPVTSFIPGPRVKAPDTVNAAHSPNEWPQIACGFTPESIHAMPLAYWIENRTA
jgi:hypothetical protein